ncbi:MAG: hypothetical protein HOM63_01495 [Kordiimonadaceae bacterium]|nr:hypothetical protein [Kordiimonadaceae bacterium]
MSDKNSAKTRQVVTAHPSSLKHSNSNKVETNSLWSKIVRNWPITIASIVSISWITLCSYYLLYSAPEIQNMSIIELSTIASATALPLVMIWIICLVLIRINPIEDNYRSREKGLDQLLNPVEITQDRIVKIIENLKLEIASIEQAGDIATDRFKILEDSFKEQVSELYNATMDADEKSLSIKNNLAGERDAITLLVNDIEKHSDKISIQFKQFKEDTISANLETKKQSEFLNNEMSFQNKTLESRSKQIEDNLESMATRLNKITDDISDKSNHSYHHLSEIIDGFDERRAVLNNFMTTMMDEVNTICDKLDKQANTVNDLSGQSAKTSEEITKSIKKQAEQLSKIADKTMKDLNASSQAIEDQTKNMGDSISEATEHSKINIAKASDYFTEKANDLNRISSDLETNIKQNFDEITDTITDKATNLGEDISIQFQNMEAEIDQGNSNINEILGANIERLSALINNNKSETEKLLSEVITSIDEQTDHIEKSLSDTRINMIDRTTLIQEEYQSLENYADRFQNKMIETEKEFKKQHKNMLSCISLIEDGLTVTIEKIKKNSTSLGTHGQKVIECIISQSSDLTSQIADIQNRSKNSIVEIQNASLQAGENILNKEKETSEIIEEWLTTANNVGVEHASGMEKIKQLMEDLEHLEETTEKSLTTSEENIIRISNKLLQSSDRIHIASNSAVEAVEETNSALDKNAEKYQQMINAIQLSSQSLAINANAIENRLKRINTENFSDISAKIMEKLQAQSIDISQYLEGEVPKDLWDNYIAGDKNIFIRKIKKYIGKKTSSQIRDHYKQDSDFRKNVDSFVQIFEELLATFTESTETVYSETLITSDIGKVYFALAEATGRLK